VLAKRENARLIGLIGGKGATSLASCGDTTSVVSVLFTVDPLKQDIEQEVTAKNANRQKYGKRHWDLTRAGVNG